MNVTVAALRGSTLFLPAAGVIIIVENAPVSPFSDELVVHEAGTVCSLSLSLSLITVRQHHREGNDSRM